MRTYLYRCWGDRGVLLYVGITGDLARRRAEHEADKEWWQDVRRMTLESWATRTEALWAEWVAIATEIPVHNRRLAGTPPPPPRPRTIIDMLSRAWWVIRTWRPPVPVRIEHGEIRVTGTKVRRPSVGGAARKPAPSPIQRRTRVAPPRVTEG